MALAGGVNVMLKPDYTVAELKAGMLSVFIELKTVPLSDNGKVDRKALPDVKMHMDEDKE